MTSLLLMVGMWLGQATMPPNNCLQGTDNCTCAQLDDGWHCRKAEHHPICDVLKGCLPEFDGIHVAPLKPSVTFSVEPVVTYRKDSGLWYEGECRSLPHGVFTPIIGLKGPEGIRHHYGKCVHDSYTCADKRDILLTDESGSKLCLHWEKK